ncbi:MAG: HAMP domain-containing histidine kinase [Proteobacteria bacterium]|nr:HAMP domain-containing histidine kinase [Pseudomonadota bacterium]MBU1711128.1 HAMP domain-containing histidine kinase [Pseudomonadota bacterium]
MFPKGIRKKITLGFYFLLFCVIFMAAVTYGIVRDVGRRIEHVEIIDDFLNTTLEVRRFEKNYFLYGKEADYKDNMAFLEKLQGLLLHDIKSLTTLMPGDVFNNLWDAVGEYKNDMQKLQELKKKFFTDPSLFNEQIILENAIRSRGKRLTDKAEQTAKTERIEIKRLLNTTGKVLLFSIVLFVFLFIVIAGFLGRNIVRSLKTLEAYTKQISRGDFVLAHPGVADEEINSLLQAFNRMTNELRIRQRQLVQSEKLASLGTLLSGVAHELNNPLSNVSSSAQILAEEIENPDIVFKRGLIEQITGQSDRARDIVRTLLEFSRIRDFTRQKLLLRSLLDETLVLLRGQVPSHVEIRLEIPEDLYIVADKQRMQQVFLNLIKNAVDVLTERGIVWVSCRDISRGSENREVEILIEDNGPGIPLEIRDKIFDPFFTTKDVGHGSGLGLFIVHDIIEMHGGTLRIDSREGEGTTFIIWLPYKSGEEK